MAGTVTIEGLGEWKEVEEVDRPSDPQEASATDDYCSVCGVPLTYAGRGKHPTKCAEHRSGQKTSTGASTAKKGSAASEKEWDTFNALVLASATYILGRWIAGGKGLFLQKPPELTDDQYEALTQHYAMTDDEVKPIAALAAKRITPTTLNKKYGRHIISVVNYEEVGMALWEYGKRVRPGLAARMNAPKAPRTAREPVQQRRGRSSTRAVPPQADPTEQFVANGKEPVSTNGTTRPVSNIEAVRLLRPRPEGGTTQGS